MDKIVNILAGITAVALVSVVVSSRESANIIKAFGNAYSGALKAAKS